MAYQTGASGGSGFVDFITALKDFAVARGWTNVKFDSSARVFFVEKGSCKVAMRWDNVNWTAYPDAGGSSYSQADVDLSFCLATTLDAGRGQADWYNHTGSIVTSHGSALKGMVNGFFHPSGGINWFFFSDAADTYIHAVCQSGERFTHLTFGLLDKGALTHSGVAFIYGSYQTWFRASNDVATSNNLWYNKPDLQTDFPGQTTGNNQGSGGGRNCGQVYAPNALPAGFDTLFAHSQRCISPYRSIRRPASAYYTSLTGRLLNHVVFAKQPSWSGVVPMFGCPLIVSNTAATQVCIPGFYPGIRIMNMDGLSPGQEIDMSGETWKVFPRMRQTNWADDVLAASSGHYGVAYKKVV